MRFKNKGLYIVLAALLIAYIFTIAFPLVLALTSSLRSYGSYIDKPLGLPRPITFENYIVTFNELKLDVISGASFRSVYLEEMLLYSLLYSVGCGLAATLTPCITAYAAAKYKYRFSRVIYLVVIVTMILPIVGSLPSEIMMMQNLRLFDSFFGVLIMKANFLGLYFLVFFAAFKALPWDFAESAFIDGAGHFRVFLRIMLPLVSNAILAVFLLNFIMFWNDFTTSMIFMPSFPTAAYGMYYMRFAMASKFGTEVMKLTACLILSTPLIILFVIFQKRLMGNLAIGGIKG
ncbi:MAG: carbohydrate ABC transporter permease [Firmicutes bacterium]|nr:carbohydrate ABC transporter permease [Bacillota bacterium]